MKCPVCGINKAGRDRYLGIIACKSCLNRHKQFTRPSAQVEFTSDNIKDERRKYFKSIIQPWREGVPSKEYAEAYPEQAKKMFSKYKKSEIKEVWKEISPQGGIDRTK